VIVSNFMQPVAVSTAYRQPGSFSLAQITAIFSAVPPPRLFGLLCAEGQNYPAAAQAHFTFLGGVFQLLILISIRLCGTDKLMRDPSTDDKL
jgi:hypothetical protein